MQGPVRNVTLTTMTRSSILLAVTVLATAWVASTTAQYTEFDLKSFFRSFSNPALSNLAPIGRGKGGRKLEIRTVCNAKNPAFEIVEGVRVNAPFCVVKEVPFCNTIEECLAECKRDVDCASIELNEGVCTLYSINYDNNPEKFEKSQIKGLHVVVQKRCVEDQNKNGNGNIIGTELLPGYSLENQALETTTAGTKDECTDRCVNEKTFKCKSANFDRQTGECQLNGVSRESLSNTQQLVQKESWLYIENNRVVEPSQVCTYETHPNLIPYSFDAFYLNVRSEDECKQKCESSRLG